MSMHLQQFFHLCKPDGTGTVDHEAFRNLCDRFSISVKDADVIFDDLDHDKDGKISFEDFSRGFSDFMGHQDPDNDDSSAKGYQDDMIAKEKDEEVNDNQEMLTKQHVWSTLTAEAGRVEETENDETKLKWLLEELHTTDKRYLVTCLETAVEDLLKNMQHLQEEKTHLEESWRREKQAHDKHLKRMEEEMDCQVKDTEMKMRIKAQTEMEDERKALQSKMDNEKDNLQAYLKLVEKVNAWMESQPADNYDVRLDEVRKKLDDAVHENRQLRMSLLDTQTSIAFMRSELLQLRTLYEEKCRELTSEREKILEVLHEQDHLSRQLNLLHDVNKRLQDTNDALRNSMDLPSTTLKRDGLMVRAKSGSILGDYFDHAYSTSTIDRFAESDEDDDADDEGNDLPKTVLRHARSMDTNFPHSKKAKNSDQRHARRQMNRSDSGVSTAQDLEEGYSSTPDSSLVIKDEKTCDRLLQVNDSTQPKRPLSLPITAPDEIIQNGANQFPQCKLKKKLDREKSLTHSASEGSILDENELPRRKISDIIKQLGIQDTTVKTWSPKLRKAPSISQISSPREAEPKPPPSPTPKPRKTAVCKTKQSKEVKAEYVSIIYL